MNKHSTRYLVKFRAWDRDTKEQHTWTMFDSYPLKRKNATCPQECTGFKDMYEKDIYVGDIIRLEDKDYFVQFFNGKYVFKELYSSNKLCMNFEEVVENQKNLIVVGNTFTHPDYILSGLTE